MLVLVPVAEEVQESLDFQEIIMRGLNVWWEGRPFGGAGIALCFFSGVAVRHCGDVRHVIGQETSLGEKLRGRWDGYKKLLL